MSTNHQLPCVFWLRSRPRPHVHLLWALWILVFSVAWTAPPAIAQSSGTSTDASSSPNSMATSPGGAPCIPLAQSRFCSAWPSARVSGNLLNYFRANPYHNVPSVPIVNSTEDFDRLIMQDIFLSEDIRSKYFQTLVGCDLGGMPVRFMTSYWCAVLLSYSPGCMELSVPTAPLCAETCNDFTASLSKLVSDASTCDPQAVKSAMSALSANISQSSSSSSPSFTTGIPIPTPSTVSLNSTPSDTTSFTIDPAWLCSSRLLSGSNLTSTTGCISGTSREPFCGWLDHDAACRNGCSSEDCPAVPTPRTRPSSRPEAVGSIALDPTGWVGLVVYLGIAVGACGLSAGAVMAGMWVWKRGEKRKRPRSEVGVGTEGGGLRREDSGYLTRQASTGTTTRALLGRQPTLDRPQPRRPTDDSLVRAHICHSPPASLSTIHMAATSEQRASDPMLEPARKFSRRRPRRPPPLDIRGSGGTHPSLNRPGPARANSSGSNPAPGSVLLPVMPTPTAPVVVANNEDNGRPRSSSGPGTARRSLLLGRSVSAASGLHHVQHHDYVHGHARTYDQLTGAGRGGDEQGGGMLKESASVPAHMHARSWPRSAPADAQQASMVRTPSFIKAWRNKQLGQLGVAKDQSPGSAGSASGWLQPVAESEALSVPGNQRNGGYEDDSGLATGIMAGGGSGSYLNGTSSAQQHFHQHAHRQPTPPRPTASPLQMQQHYGQYSPFPPYTPIYDSPSLPQQQQQQQQPLMASTPVTAAAPHAQASDLRASLTHMTTTLEPSTFHHPNQYSSHHPSSSSSHYHPHMSPAYLSEYYPPSPMPDDRPRLCTSPPPMASPPHAPHAQSSPAGDGGGGLLPAEPISPGTEADDTILSANMSNEAAATAAATRRAHLAYVSDRSDELNVEPGDMLLVLEVYEDGWCHGYNWSTRYSGVFPLAVFEEIPQEEGGVVVVVGAASEAEVSGSSGGDLTRSSVYDEFSLAEGDVEDDLENPNRVLHRAPKGRRPARASRVVGARKSDDGGSAGPGSRRGSRSFV